MNKTVKIYGFIQSEKFEKNCHIKKLMSEKINQTNPYKEWINILGFVYFGFHTVYLILRYYFLKNSIRNQSQKKKVIHDISFLYAVLTSLPKSLLLIIVGIREKKQILTLFAALLKFVFKWQSKIRSNEISCHHEDMFYSDFKKAIKILFKCSSGITLSQRIAAFERMNLIDEETQTDAFALVIENEP